MSVSISSYCGTTGRRKNLHKIVAALRRILATYRHNRATKQRAKQAVTSAVPRGGYGLPVSYLRDLLTGLAVSRPALGIGPALDDLRAIERHQVELRRELEALRHAVDQSPDRAGILRRFRAVMNGREPTPDASPDTQ
jgi:hypothetical protein